MSQSVSKNAQTSHEAPTSDDQAAALERSQVDPSLRVDGPHLGHLASAGQSHGVLEPNPFAQGIDLSREIPRSLAQVPAALPLDDDPSPRGERILLQANQIAEHFRKKSEELDRREQRLNSQLALLDQERRNVRLWVGQFDLQVQDRESALQYREAACAEREAAAQLAEKELQSLRLQLRLNDEESIAAREGAILQGERELEEQRAEIERRRAELAEERQRQIEAIAAEREEKLRDLDRRETELDQLESSLELARSRQDAELHKERGLLDSRLRFREEHLQKTRRDLETTQQQFHLERQSARAKLEQDETRLRLQSRQAARFREILDEQERSLQREEGFLAESRVQAEDSAQREALRLADERRSWEREREIQWAEIHRQQERLAGHAELLESRQDHLDQLRTELENSNCAILEMRVAIEEVCSQFAKAVGPDVARANIDAAREDLAIHYQQAHQGLSQQRQELEQLRQQLHCQRQEFQEERAVLKAWVEERDEQLRSRALELQNERDIFDSREQAWVATRENWKREKLEAEAIIRDLLRQLGEQASPPSANSAEESG